MTLAMLCLGVLWLATRPYVGVVHDAKLYAAQALAWLHPERFGQDLFFAFGNQDSFTVFSALYAPIVAWLGLPVAHAVMLALGHAVWLGGAWLLAAALVPDPRLRFWAVATAIIMPSLYGGGSVLRYGEAFVTPRLFAEAATLAGLGLALRGRWVCGLLLLAAGAVMHPLMVLPGVGLLLLLHLFGLRRGVTLPVGLCALALVLLLALTWVLPPLDAEWQSVVAARSPFVLIRSWDRYSFLFLAVQVALCALLLLALTGRPQRVAATALLLGAAGVLATLSSGDLGQAQLVVAVQPWRALWLFLVVVNLMLVPAAIALRREGYGALPGAWPVLLGVLLFLAGSRLIPGLVVGLAPLLLLALVHVGLHRRGYRPGLGGLAALRLAFWLVAIVAASTIALAVQWLATNPMEQRILLPRQAILTIGGLVLLAVATFAALPRRAARGVALASGGVLLAAALASLDQRTAWMRFIERPGSDQAALEAFIPDGGNVFWDGGIDLMWFRLNRPSYFSCAQAAGVVFHRGTAIAFRDRAAALGVQRMEGTCFASLVPRSAPPGRAELEAACRALPALDHIVLVDRIETFAAASWRVPVAREIPGSNRQVQPPGDVYRYDCATLREAATMEAHSP